MLSKLDTVEEKKKGGPSPRSGTRLSDDRNVREALVSPEKYVNHPLAELREAFVEYSNFSGSDQRDPYRPIEHAACYQQQMERTGS